LCKDKHLRLEKLIDLAESKFENDNELRDAYEVIQNKIFPLSSIGN
jgi:hypothetical protein